MQICRSQTGLLQLSSAVKRHQMLGQFVVALGVSDILLFNMQESRLPPQSWSLTKNIMSNRERMVV